MKVVRIEHPDTGCGLWQTEINGYVVYRNLSFLNDLVDKHESFPIPNEDGLYRENHHFCAFKSIEQANEWIESEWWNEILSLGFKIYLIELSAWLEGEYQIMFEKQHIVQSEDISSLFVTK